MIAVSQQLNFHEIELSQAATLIDHLEAQERQGCESCFSTLYIWRNRYHTQMATDSDGYVFFRSGEGEERGYLLPGGANWEEKVRRLSALCREKKRPLLLYGGDETTVGALQRAFPGQFDVWSDPADTDYLYRRADLAELKGKAYDGKRNHIRAFSRKYAWRYEPLEAANADDFLAVARRWREEKDPQDAELKAEYEAIGDAVAHREALHVKGGLIRVEEQAVAITLGAPIRRDTFDIQIEKALASHREAYAVINREFAARELADYTWINRENDLGIEGLRRAKLSYHPACLLKKYSCKERT